MDESQGTHGPHVEWIVEQVVEGLIRDEPPTDGQDSLLALFQPSRESHMSPQFVGKLSAYLRPIL